VANSAPVDFRSELTFLKEKRELDVHPFFRDLVASHRTTPSSAGAQT